MSEQQRSPLVESRSAGPSEARRTTGTLVMQTLAGYGIDTVFGIPGTHNLEFYRQLTTLGIRPVTTRHEQGAGYAADAWSQRTGKPGVVLTTSGPGLLNALSAAGTAFAQSRPMIVLAPGPDRGVGFADVGTLHETKDQFGAAESIVGWARRVDSAAQAVEAVHDAFAFFSNERPRPVYVEVPLDLLESEVDGAEVSETALAPRPLGAPDDPEDPAIDAAARLLDSADRPVILAGGGSRGAAAELRMLAERLAAPVVTTTSAKGVLDESHPLSLGSTLRLASARELARRADVLLVVGSKLGEAELWVDRLDAEGDVIRIDVAQEQLNKNQPAALGLLGHADVVLSKLNAVLGEAADAPALVERTAAVAASVADTVQSARDESRRLSPASVQIAESIVQALPEKAVVSTDSSQIAYRALDAALVCSEPNTLLYMATYATLGYGLPAGLGVAVADPDRPSVVVTGDGALAFSLNEMITVVEQGASVTIIVVDNGGYAEIKQNEADVGIAAVGVDLKQPDWPALAVAFGGRGVEVHDGPALSDAVASATRIGGLQLIHLDQSSFRP